MKVGRLHLDLKDGIKKEWLITNGIGGYASSTVVGANTRRYHGLLIAPLNPPANRYLICSKVDESIKIGNKDYSLFTNICKSFISSGYKKQESFEKEYYPIFKYKVDDVRVEKRVVMHYGHNTTIVQYNIQNGKQESILTLSPIVNFRDFHSMTTGRDFMLKQELKDNKVKLTINNNEKNPIYMYASDGEYSYYTEDTFRNMYYLKEEERGYYPEENLAVTGCYTIKLNPRESKTVNFIISLESNIDKLKPEKIFEDEEKRLQSIIDKADLIKTKSKYTRQEREKNQVVKDLIIASDSFVIDRSIETTVNKRSRDEKTEKVSLKKIKKVATSKSVIAGYPWFLDWGRDALISFEGLFLVTNRFDDAQKLLLTFIQDIKGGLVPNGYDESTDKPLYNSVDSSLLLFEAVNRYIKYTKDYNFIKSKIYSSLVDIVDNYIEGINVSKNNIYMTKEGLLHSGNISSQNTWMDAKIGDYVVTPRNGEVVEINAMFYNALKTLEHLAKKFGHEETVELCKKHSKKLKSVFMDKFYNSRKECLNDLVNDDKIRPNQVFALSLTYPVVDLKSEYAMLIFNTITSKLLMTHGLKSLARGEVGFQAEYEGDPYQRDMVYHQGPTWVWLLGPYMDAYENLIEAEKDASKKKQLQAKFDRFVDDVYVTFKKELYDAEGIGQVSELYDSKLPYKAGGCYAQAWSVSEVLRVIIKRNR